MRIETATAAAIFAAAVCSCAHPRGAARGPCGRSDDGRGDGRAVGPAPEPGERHFARIRQLTFGGENAEAYFSRDGRRLIFQSTRDGRTCDQQFVMNIDGSGIHRVSTGFGKTTCGYFFDGDRRIFFASTHAADRRHARRSPIRQKATCGVWIPTTSTSPIRTDRRFGVSRAIGVYTAEGTLSPDGQTIVFTSLKDGDLDIYTMRVDGTNLKRLTFQPGYDGGPFFSPDGKRIVYRAWHPADTALTSYRELLRQRLVRPNRMEIWVMNADGSDQHQITNLGGANFAPVLHPRRPQDHLLVQL